MNKYYEKPQVCVYLKWVRLCQEAFAQGKRVRTRWTDSYNGMDYEEWRREFRQALDRRINDKGGIVQRGRKYDYLYQLNMQRDQRALHDYTQRRIRGVYRLSTPELQKRFGHLLPSWDD